jgi:IS30 family transposase
MKIAENRELEDFVEAGLYDDLSPEAIAGQIKSHKKNLIPVSKDSIRRWIKSVYGRKIEYYRKKKKTRRYRRRAKSQKLNDRVFINKRPEYINKRRRIGDAEADFMVSGKTGKGIILNVTDRKSRTTFLELILEVNIENVHRAFQRIKTRFPELKTITTDNDILLQRHKELEALLNVKIYFCDPYSSWQKGTVENSNKYVRRDVPKGSNLSKYSSKFIKSIEEKLNRRPLKCLRYKTPNEVLDESRKHKKHGVL